VRGVKDSFFFCLFFPPNHFSTNSRANFLSKKKTRNANAVKRGPRYDKWSVARTGTSPEIALRLRNVVPFVPARWPGYRHRRTLGFAAGLSAEDNEDVAAAGARTFVFDHGAARADSDGESDAARDWK
jgi:hypothetical protein